MPAITPVRERARAPSQKFNLAAVFSASFGVGLIFGFQPPLMALVLERAGASSFEIGAVSSISTVAVMLCGPLYPGAIGRLGLRLAVILGIAVSTAVILQLPIGRLGDRLGRQRVLALCAGVCVVGPLLLSAVMGILWLVWPLLLLWGGTMYGFYTQGIALLGESYPRAELADANTVFVVVYCAGGMVGPSLGGLAMDCWRPNGLLVFLSGAPLLLAGGLLSRVRSRAS